MDNDSPKTIDWLAIRAAYETGAETVCAIAGLHGVSKDMIDRRRVKEGWPKRLDTGRIAPRPAAARITDHVDWPAVRHDYEMGEYSVSEVARRHGCSRSRLHYQREREHWQARRPGYPRAYGAGGIVAAPQRRKAGLTKKLGILATRLDLAEEIDLSDPLKGLDTLANVLEKLLEAREKSGDDTDRLSINDASRDALAQRLEALADSWERKRDSAGAGCERARAD